jgi:putative tryptophan/tyrosine transport system substrate-binding protein
VRRRTFITLLGGAAAGLPLTARAQQTAKVHRIGLLSPTSQGLGMSAFRDGLRALGYLEGHNIIIEHRSADGRYERLPDLAAELARLRVDIIVAVVTQASVAAKNATSTIPIVMLAVGDPVGAGLVTNLARPGGNVTGTSFMAVEAGGKSLELLKDVAPNLHLAGVLWNPSNPVFQSQMVNAT